MPKKEIDYSNTIIYKITCFKVFIIFPKYKFGNTIEHTTRTKPFTTPVTYPCFIVFLPMFNIIPKYAKASINSLRNVSLLEQWICLFALHVSDSIVKASSWIHTLYKL